MAAFPAIILLTLYVDQINDYYHKNRSLLIASLGNLVKLFLMTSAVLCLLLLPLTAKIIYQRWSLDNKMLKTNIAYLQANVKAPIETLILSRNSGIYYLALQTACPANIPSPSEFILRKDYDQLANYLHASPKGSIVFYDKNYDNDLVVKELKRVYRLISSGPGGEIKKYEK
jgi:hypothetical protein